MPQLVPFYYVNISVIVMCLLGATLVLYSWEKLPQYVDNVHIGIKRVWEGVKSSERSHKVLGGSSVRRTEALMVEPSWLITWMLTLFGILVILITTIIY